MTYEPQRFTAPDGTAMVVLPASDYERLLAAAAPDEDARDVRAAERALAASDVRYPDTVVGHILAGHSPIAAWRMYCGLSQAQLARRAGLAQTAISRLERTQDGRLPLGRRETRAAIARVLDIPVAALDPLED